MSFPEYPVDKTSLEAWLTAVWHPYILNCTEEGTIIFEVNAVGSFRVSLMEAGSKTFVTVYEGSDIDAAIAVYNTGGN